MSVIKRGRTWLWALAVGGAALAGFGASIGYVEYRFIETLAYRPPVAVVDYSKVEELLLDGVAPGELKGVLAALKERSELLQENGFVVIRSNAVDAAPAGLLFPDEAGWSEFLPASLKERSDKRGTSESREQGEGQ